MDELNKLRDVKSIVNIDIFNPIWIAIAILILLIAISLLYFFKKKRKKYRFKKSKEELAIDRIKNINYDDAKSVAYTFAKDLSLFVNEQNRDIFNKIEKELEEYKYKKDVPALKEDIKQKVKEFIKGIKWEI